MNGALKACNEADMYLLKQHWPINLFSITFVYFMAAADKKIRWGAAKYSFVILLFPDVGWRKFEEVSGFELIWQMKK